MSVCYVKLLRQLKHPKDIMASQTHLTQRSGSANYYYREAIPPDVRSLLGADGKRAPSEVWLSLGTPDLKIAKQRLVGVRAAQYRRWAALRAATSAPPTINPNQGFPNQGKLDGIVAHLYGKNLQIRLNKWKLANSEGPTAEDAFVEGERAELRKAAREQMAGMTSAWVAAVSDAVIVELGWTLPKTDVNGEETAEYRKLAGLVLEALSAAQRVALERFDGNPWAEPQSPVVKQAINSVALRPAIGESLMELFDRYAKQTVAEGRKKLDTVTQDRKTVNLFSTWIGKRSAESIDKKDVREFRNLIAELPLKYNTRRGYQGLSLVNMAEKGRNESLQKRELRTIAKEISAISSFFSWLVSEGYANENPTFGLTPRFDKTKGRLPCYTFDQLNAVFSSPLFTGCESRTGKEHLVGDTKVRDWRYWLPLCAMFTGARVGELAQLRPEDVREEAGIWIFDLVNDDDKVKATSLKSPASRRTVPIHTSLRDFGFLNYVEILKAAGSVRLFPELKVNNRGQHGATPSRFLRKYLERLGIKTEGDGLGFHSFRHTFTDELRRNDVFDGVITTLLGHTTGTMTEKYGAEKQGSLAQRTVAIEKIIYVGVNLEHLKTKNRVKFETPTSCGRHPSKNYA
jgi:integrase